MKGWLIFICWVILGLALLGWGISLWAENYRFSRAAVVLDGKVVDINSSVSDGGSVNGLTIEYSMPNGEVRRLDSRFESSTSSYSIGDRVKVLWVPDSGKIKLDSFGELYFPALFVILVAGFVLIGPVFCVAVWVWIWGLPTKANLCKMRNAMADYLATRRT